MKKMKKTIFYCLIVFLVLFLIGCETSHKHKFIDGVCECGEIISEDENSSYTYNYALSEFSNNWNPHTYQTENIPDILNHTTSGFYKFDYNETKDGYKLVPDMAKSKPQDVTSQYVGDKWGIEEGETGRVYKIDLKDNLEWEDGTIITAESFVESAKRLLDPQANNYRATSFYQGDFVIANAKPYYYQSKTNFYPADFCYEEYPSDGSLDDNLIFTLSEPSEKYNNQEISFRKELGFDKNYHNTEITIQYMVRFHLRGTAFTYETGKAMEGKTLAEIKANPTLKAAWDALINCYKPEPNEELKFFLVNYTWPKVEWENVGILEEDGDLVLVLEEKLEGFDLLNVLTKSWLVHEELYDKCIKLDENGNYSNSYGTSVETFKSYGPYKLTYFELDKEYKFAKNEHWYGYDEDSNRGFYQTTNIVCKYISDYNVRLQEFEKGNLDSYGLQASDKEKYINSSELYYEEKNFTLFIALNPSLEGLNKAQEKAGENINKTILTILEFRQALSFSVDRAQFCLKCHPTGKPAIAVFNDLIISDRENGTSFRSHEEAKDNILKYWELIDEVGEGKQYATKEEAIASIIGVDLIKAKEKFTIAYNKAIEAGLMDNDDVVQLTIGIPSLSEFYKNGSNFLIECWSNAVKGTPLEGKLIFDIDSYIGSVYTHAVRINRVDILFSVGYDTNVLYPYTLMPVYTDPSYQYDPAIDYSTIEAEVYFDSVIDVNGKEWKNVTLVDSVFDWANKALLGEIIECSIKETKETIKIKFDDKDSIKMKEKILCIVEDKMLEQYTMLPLEVGASTILKGKQINYSIEKYVYGVNYGGIKYITYNYSDEAWERYIKSVGGNIDYTN